MCKEHICYMWHVYESKGTISILLLHFYMQLICCRLVSSSRTWITRTSVIMKKCCLYGSEPETCLVVLPYVGIFQSCLGAKPPKQILPVVLSLDLWAMLPTLWSQLVSNSMEQNPYGDASQIPYFFMEPEISSPWSQKLIIYPCSEHDQLRLSPPPPYTCGRVALATSALYMTSYLQLYPLSCYDSLTYKKILSPVNGFHFRFHREQYNPLPMQCLFVPSHS